MNARASAFLATIGLTLVAALSPAGVLAQAQAQPQPPAPVRSPGTASANVKTLKVMMHADLAVLDPTFTSVYITRNFGYMVYDTLFARDAQGKPQPQMVDTYTSSPDGLRWRFTLRPGLRFSDGQAVRPADAIASLERWSARDGMGRAMTAAGARWTADGADAFALTLERPFGLVLEALSKPSGYPPLILPERLARLPTTAPITEVVGSGPYLFKREEWVPGSKAVFVRNPDYVARTEPPSGLAGSKKSHFDRVEWVRLPDNNSAVAALRAGEIDMIESFPPDYIAPARTDPRLRLVGIGALQGLLVMNHTLPPFNDARARQALAHAVVQERFTAALGYPLDRRMTHCPSYFVCGSANDTTAGAERYRQPDLAKARRLLAEAGYRGEKIVVLVPSDVEYLNAGALVAVQALRSIGMDVDAQTMDWASIGARRLKRDPAGSGGWNLYATTAVEFDLDSPINNTYLSAACGNSLPGWPCDAKLDELRAAWLQETVPARRRERLEAFHARAMETVPYVNAGQMAATSAVRAEIKGPETMRGALPTFWTFDR